MKKLTVADLKKTDQFKLLAKTNARLFATEDGQFFLQQHFAESHAGTKGISWFELNTGTKASEAEKAQLEEERKKLLGHYTQLTNDQLPENTSIKKAKAAIEKARADMADGKDVRSFKTTDQIKAEEYKKQYKSITGKELNTKGLSLAAMEHEVMEATKKAKAAGKKEQEAKEKSDK